MEIIQIHIPPFIGPCRFFITLVVTYSANHNGAYLVGPRWTFDKF